MGVLDVIEIEIAGVVDELVKLLPAPDEHLTSSIMIVKQLNKMSPIITCFTIFISRSPTFLIEWLILNHITYNDNQ